MKNDVIRWDNTFLGILLLLNKSFFEIREWNNPPKKAKGMVIGMSGA